MKGRGTAVGEGVTGEPKLSVWNMERRRDLVGEGSEASKVLSLVQSIFGGVAGRLVGGEELDRRGEIWLPPPGSRVPLGISGGSVSSGRAPKKDSGSFCFVCMSTSLEVPSLSSSLPCECVRLLAIRNWY